MHLPFVSIYRLQRQVDDAEEAAAKALEEADALEKLAAEYKANMLQALQQADELERYISYGAII